MGEAPWKLPRETVGDVACSLLRENGKPMLFKDLLPLIAARGVVRAETPARVAAIIHTEINLDGRLQHLGGGLWGLRQWSPRRRPERAATPRLEWPEEDALPPEDPEPSGACEEAWSEDTEHWDE
ncbi:MAG: DNA-directed RNA polymerase subunit delta [bacterium]|nr:DNA-directed RNA polymerase subunit delta [bacterium]